MIVSDVRQLVIGQHYVIRRGKKPYRNSFVLRGVDGEFLSVIIDGETKVTQFEVGKALKLGIITD